MGRAKLKLERLEPGASRNTTYTKRRHGLTKKVSELSILCDVDVMLLTFSPSGRPAFFKSENSSMEEIIKKFAQLTPQERAQRKLESLEVLKKAFKNVDHDINLQDPFGPDYHSAEDLAALAELLRSRLADINYNLSCWTYMDEIESIEQLTQMKESLRKSLFEVWNCKEIIQRQQLGVQCSDQHHFEERPDLHCPDQFQQGIDLPVDLASIDQQLQLLSWIEHHHKQTLDLQRNLYLFHHGLNVRRDTACSGSGAMPFEGYPDIRTPDQMAITNGHQHHFSMDIPNAAQENGNPTDLIDSGYVDDFLRSIASGHEHGFPVDLSRTGNEDGLLVNFTDGGHGHTTLMEFAETKNDTGQKYDNQEFDIARELAGHKKDILMDLMDVHHEREMPIGFSQTENELGIPMDVIQFANDHGISMDVVRTAHEEVFPNSLIENGGDYGASMDLRKAETGDGQHCIPMVHTETGNQNAMFVDMLKDRHEYYITDETDRTDNLHMQAYKGYPDKPFRFPLLSDNSFQPQEHVNMQENALAPGIDKYM